MVRRWQRWTEAARGRRPPAAESGAADAAQHQLTDDYGVVRYRRGRLHRGGPRRGAAAQVGASSCTAAAHRPRGHVGTFASGGAGVHPAANGPRIRPGGCVCACCIVDPFGDFAYRPLVERHRSACPRHRLNDGGRGAVPRDGRVNADLLVGATAQRAEQADEGALGGAPAPPG